MHEESTPQRGSEDNNATAPPLPRVGFVGVGIIAEALVLGMCANGEQRATFLLSPRNPEIAQRLARKFPFVTVAADNQAVVDGSDILFITVRPQVAEQVMQQLLFRADQQIVSVVATFNLDRVRPLVAPAQAVMRCTPLPSVARRLGVVILHPPVPRVASLLDGLGRLFQVDSEADIDTLGAPTGLFSSYFGMLGCIATWLTEHGIEATEARAFVAAMYHALSVTALEHSCEGFEALLKDHTTPGGLNEQAYRELESAGWNKLMAETLDLISDRIRGRTTLAGRIPSNT